jgi:hypothetical protein
VTETPDQPAEERVARHLAARDWLTDEGRWENATASFRADYLAAAREVIALVPSAGPAPATDRADLRDRIADMLAADDGWKWVDGFDKARSPAYQGYQERAAAVLALLPARLDRAALLREEAARIRAHCPDHLDSDSVPGAWMVCHCAVADDLLRRMADEPPQPNPEPTPDEPTVRATRYLVTCMPEHRDPGGYRGVTVEYRGDDRWAVLDGTLCLGSDGRWDRERQSTERDEEWLDAHRFDLGTAWRLAEEQAKDAVRPAKDHCPAVVAQPDGEA